MQDYIAKRAGNFMGNAFRKGDALKMHPKQAKYLLMDGTIALATAKTAPTAAPATQEATTTQTEPDEQPQPDELPEPSGRKSKKGS